MIPQVLMDVRDYLRSKQLTLATGSEDPRQDSAKAETQVVQILQNANRWRVVSPNVETNLNRSWYDALINNLYVDVKISTCRTYDNTNAKKAIYWFLTGLDPDKTTSNTAKVFFPDMKSNESPSQTRDYYYVIVNKENTSDVFVVSLKGIADCRPSNNNPPFQAKWGDCRAPVKRTWHEARNFLLSNWAFSIAKDMELLSLGMPRSYPQFFKT